MFRSIVAVRQGSEDDRMRERQDPCLEPTWDSGREEELGTTAGRSEVTRRCDLWMDRLTVWCCRRRCHPSYRRRRCRPAQPVMVPSRAHTQVVRPGQALPPHHPTATTLTARAVPCGQRLLSAHNLSRTRSPSTTNALTHTDTHTHAQRTVYPTVRSGDSVGSRMKSPRYITAQHTHAADSQEQTPHGSTPPRHSIPKRAEGQSTDSPSDRTTPNHLDGKVSKRNEQKKSGPALFKSFARFGGRATCRRHEVSSR
jgi:hypothetical protein